LDIVELTRKTVLRLWREKFADEIYAVLSSFLPVEKNIIDYIKSVLYSSDAGSKSLYNLEKCDKK